MKNTGIEYEKIVQKVFQSILNQKSVENITVEHDVTLQGKSTTHQIDVYWKFSDGISQYSTIVQAKDYSSRVSQEKLLAFKSVIDDLPERPKGIFVTKTGYQRGAKAYAEANDILLYELRHPTDDDWNGYIRDISIKLTMFTPQISNFTTYIDKDWVCKNYPDAMDKINIPSFTENDFLYNEKGDKTIPVLKLVNDLINAQSAESSSTVVEKVFLEPTFIYYGKYDIKLLKINKISFMVDYNRYDDTIEIHGDDIVKFILKNVLKNETNNVDPLFNVHL